MFANELIVCSEGYRLLASKYRSTKELNDASTLESLLFKMIIAGADYWPEHSLPQVYRLTSTRQAEWLFAVNTLCQEFFRETMYGPSRCYHTPSSKPELLRKEMEFTKENKSSSQCDYSKVIEEMQLKELVPIDINSFDYDYLCSEPFIQRRNRRLNQELSVEGEPWIEAVAYPQLLLVLKQVVELICNDTNFTESYKLLVRGRLGYFHNMILDRPVKSLAELTIGSYTAYEAAYRQQPSLSLTHFIAVKLEFSNVLLFYYKYTEAEKSMEMCKQVLNVEIEYTGKLGRRTKFQQFDTAQLVVKLEQYNSKKHHEELSEVDKEIIRKERQELPPIQQVLFLDNKPSENALKAVNFEEDSILYEVPKFTEEATDATIRGLEKQLLVLTHSYYIYESSPKEETLFLKLNSLVASLLASNPIYSLKFALLVLRSLNELPRYKNSDRALEQLTQLVDQYNTVEKGPEDLTLIMSTPVAYQIRVLLLKIVAEKLFSQGLLMSGVELYEQVGMIEECIEGLVSGSHKDRAEKMAVQLIKKQEGYASPRVLCLLADVRRDPEGYQKAWEVSGHKYSRAQKSLARMHYNKKNFEEAIKSYKLALGVNSYDPSSWFTLGICHMALKQMDEALKCFSQSVSIDESQGEAWGNLASCYIALKKFSEAYMTLEQAVKYCQYEWRIWSNLMGVSIKLKKFYKYFDCIERVVVLGQVDLITYEVMARVVQVFQYKLAFFADEKKRNISAHRNRIQRLFDFLKKEIGQKPVVWKYYCEFLALQLEYLQEMSTYFTAQHEGGKLDPYDIVPQYEVPTEIAAYTEAQNKRIRTQMLDAKQKQCNMVMVVGWQTSKKQCELLAVSLKELCQYYREQGLSDDKDLGVFVKSVKKKLEDCLERNIDFEE